MKLINILISIAIILALVVITLGAYTRLKDAGLGCPDWPGCYGKLIAPTTADDIAIAESNFPNQSFESEKAWTEMIHRYVAGGLGLLIATIVVVAFSNRKKITTKIIISVTALLFLLIFQALLGMWTVTMRLYPVVVMGHLLGGFSILAILCWLKLQFNHNDRIASIKINSIKQIQPFALLSLLFLTLQLALGGWTSANYAAVVCSDFPTCQGLLWPPMDFATAFNLFNAGIFDSPGVALENTARVTIQMSHRIGALLVTIFLSFTCYKLFKSKSVKLIQLGILATLLLITQIILGISNVLAGLPLAVAVAHNAVGALLLIVLITINSKIRRYSNQKLF